MKMLMQVKIPNQRFNAAVREKTVGKTINQILEELKPEAVYFTELEGQRGAIIVVDVKNPADVPSLAEPWFLAFDAQVEFKVMMTPQDLKNSGVDTIGCKWG